MGGGNFPFQKTMQGVDKGETMGMSRRAGWLAQKLVRSGAMRRPKGKESSGQRTGKRKKKKG